MERTGKLKLGSKCLIITGEPDHFGYVQFISSDEQLVDIFDVKLGTRIIVRAEQLILVNTSTAPKINTKVTNRNMMNFAGQFHPMQFHASSWLMYPHPINAIYPIAASSIMIPIMPLPPTQVMPPPLPLLTPLPPPANSPTIILSSPIPADEAPPAVFGTFPPVPLSALLSPTTSYSRRIPRHGRPRPARVNGQPKPTNSRRIPKQICAVIAYEPVFEPRPILPFR